ncbi:TlpA family protein disulfide reductase [Natronorubrum texcoconense]|uniref:Redoxin n=1 Tax=Natronorubrum texcoconense TaxID=1095776 RepID=A0A1G9AKP5_9EURY|nr:TlpA disulfide reductase family protein [Natronorubrum texcoconense]SDK27939.1 Redoxin [Natronorubrum texcoconense]
MRRRAFVIVGAGAVSIACAGCLDDGNDAADESETETTDDSPPFEIQTLDAPGSEAGTITIPRAGQVMLINFTRTDCPTSRGLLPAIDDARAELEAAETDVEVVSLFDDSSGPSNSPAELADWWDEHDGNWTVGIDERGVLNDYYDVRSFPTLVAIDGDGEVHWRNEGGTTASNIVSGVERTLEAQASAAGDEETNGDDNEGTDDESMDNGAEDGDEEPANDGEGAADESQD